MSKSKILIADDEKNIRLPCQEILEEEGYDVTLAANGTETIKKLAESEFDIVLLDLRMPGHDGMEILREIHQNKSGPDVIIITGQGTIRDAVEATKLGAFDFLEKPLQPDRLLITVKNCLKQRDLAFENVKLKELVNGSVAVFGNNNKMKELSNKILKIAPTDCWVLIVGETGSGKELVAKKIHKDSQRAIKPFVEVNCSAIPKELIESEMFGHVKGAFTGAFQNKKGKFEQADGGTIFLDEIGDMDLDVQAKLLRVLESGEFVKVGSNEKMKVDVRVISATNKDLNEEIKNSNFREDLYFRLNVVALEIPPLRERLDDLPILVDYFLEFFSKKNDKASKSLSSEAMKSLSNYHWPGNVRELKNLIERLVILSSSDIIDHWELEMLWGKRFEELFSDNTFQDINSLKEAKFKFEKQFISSVLKKNKGNITETAKTIGLNRSHLHEKIRELGIRYSEE